MVIALTCGFVTLTESFFDTLQALYAEAGIVTLVITLFAGLIGVMAWEELHRP